MEKIEPFITKYRILLLIIWVALIFISFHLALTVIGLLFLVLSIYGMRLSLKLNSQGLESEGIVIRLEQKKRGLVAPIVSFQTESGDQIEGAPLFYTSTTSNLSRRIITDRQEEEKVIIIYNPQKPSSFIIKGDELKNMIGGIFIILIALTILNFGILGLAGIY